MSKPASPKEQTLPIFVELPFDTGGQIEPSPRIRWRLVGLGADPSATPLARVRLHLGTAFTAASAPKP